MVKFFQYLFSLFVVGLFMISGCSPEEVGKASLSDTGRLADSILANISEPVIPDYFVNIQDLAGIKDTTSDYRKDIEEAIKLCSSRGGGKIIFPAGKYMVRGPIHLESNIELYLDEDAEIIFGGDYSNYLPAVKTRWEGIILYNYSPFIYAINKENIAITGKGTINGNSLNTWNTWVYLQTDGQERARKMNHLGVPVEERIFGEGDFLRTCLIEFYECKNILIDGVKITDSPFWCIHPVFSKNIIVRNVRFSANNHNNDGIDPDSSEDILIDSVIFDNRDDNIAIKSGRDREGRELGIPSRNILIRNCFFKGHNAFCIGSEMSGDVYNVIVENCSYAGSVRAGFYLKSNEDRGGKIYRIRADNLEFDSCRYVIEMDTDYKNEGNGHPAVFYDIKVENLKANYAGDHGISIVGIKEKPLHDILIGNVIIQKANAGFKAENFYSLNLEKVFINGQIVESR